MDDRTQLMSATPLAPGNQVSWYTIREVLGTGGFGVTYLAEDTNLDRAVAIKEYLPTSFAHRHGDQSVKPITLEHEDNFSWGLSNFLKEAKTLAKFNHENIVRVHAVFEVNNTAYMVMEYENGDNLASIIKERGSISQDFQERIFYPIMEGLNKIHELGFIHRDIKPSNIYIRENGSPVLIDFGSARQTSLQQSSEFTTLISQGYTPLEQYSSDFGEQGPWTDIYSLAATIYHGVTGNKPDDSIGRSACMSRSQPDRVTRLLSESYPDYQQKFLDAVYTGINLHPEQRPQSLTDWQTLFQSQGNNQRENRTQISSSKRTDYSEKVRHPWEVTSVYDSEPPRDRAPKRSSRWLALPISLLIVALGGGLLFYLLQKNDSPHSAAIPDMQDITPNNAPTKTVVAEMDSNATMAETPATIIPETQPQPVHTPSDAPVVKTASAETNKEPQNVTLIRFDLPLAQDTNTPTRSIKELATANPAFAPIEELDEAAWKGQNCSSCHSWNQQNLCTQGEFYNTKDDSALTRLQHPFGGFFKSALKEWASQGCPD